MSARLRIDLSAFAQNYKLCAQAVAQAPFEQEPISGGVVKADGYGLGAEVVAQKLLDLGCENLFVATCTEGALLRVSLPSPNIYVFEGPRESTLAELAAAGLIPVVNSPQQLQLMQQWSAHNNPPTLPKVALHLDTGMNRLGFSIDEFSAVDLTGLELIMLMTHFSCADDSASDTSAAQIAQFCEQLTPYPNTTVSIGNSAGSLSDELMQAVAGGIGSRQLVTRPGIALYGGQPFANPLADEPRRSIASMPLWPVATLEGQVLQLRSIPAGASVGYGQSYRATQARKLATVGLGYADGLPRLLSNKGGGYCKGHYCPIVGRISMDLVTLDVTDAPVAVGDWIEFYGKNLSISDVAALAQTIDYELLVSVGPRVQREILPAKI